MSTRPWRFGALGISFGVALLGLTVGMAGAGQEFVSGSGRARASILEVGLRTGGLTIPVTFGRSVVSFQGSEAKAASLAQGPPKGGPPKAPGTAQPTADCGGGGGTPNPFGSTIEVSSSDKDPHASVSFLASPPDSPIQGSLQTQEVAAGREPSGRAVTIHGTMALPGGLMEGTRARAEATTGVVDGRARLSHAVVTLDRLSLAGGAVVLHGMRWEATQRTGESGAVEVADASFSFGGAMVGSSPLPGGGGGGAGALAAVNQVLAPTGLALIAPVVERENGVARVSPLSVRIADSPLGRQAVGPLLGSLQPVRDPLAEGLLRIDCRFGGAITAADVALGVLSGSGGMTLDLGGVMATSEGTRYDNPLAGPIGDDLGAPGGDVPLPASTTAEAAAPAPSPVPPEDLAAALPEAPSLPGSGYSATGPVPPEDLLAAPPAPGAARPATLGPASTRMPGRKGGAALAVGIVGLLAVLALGVADAVHIRRASRSIP